MSLGIITRLGAILTLALFAAGCDSIQGNQTPVFTGAEENKTARTIDSKEAIDTYFNKRKTDADKKDYRDEIITYRMNAINTNYRVFVTELREARAGTGLAADSTITALGFLTAIIGGAGTKSALGAGVAAVSGAKGAFDKNIFYEKALAAVIAQMDTERAVVTQQIRQGMKAGVTEYPLIAALDDLARLERAGSIELAIAGLTKTATDNAQIEEAKINSFPIKRDGALSKFILTPAGRQLEVDFVSDVDKLIANNLTKALELAITKPAVPSVDVDKKIEQQYGKIDPSKFSTAGKGKIAKTFIMLRYMNASAEERTIWESAVK